MSSSRKMDWLAPDADPGEQSAFPGLAACERLEGQQINANWMSRLVRVEAGSRHYYVKIYRARGRWLRRFAGRSRVRAEWENLRFFMESGIPTSAPVAFGETPRVGGDYLGVLVTREIPGTRDLADLAGAETGLFADRRWRRGLIRRLGDVVQRMHHQAFVHNDLKWRNILVSTEADPAVYIIDCPLGRKMFGPFLVRGIIKDLACLDKVAKYQLSRTDRLRLYLACRGKSCLDRQDRETIARILRFFEGRE